MKGPTWFSPLLTISSADIAATQAAAIAPTAIPTELPLESNPAIYNQINHNA
jgi:hypothetical protein